MEAEGQRESDDPVSSGSSGTLLPAPSHAVEGPQPQSAPSAPPFVAKLHEVLSKDEYRQYIAWNAAGETFVIKDCVGLASHVLQVVWTHSNINSFYRQLNAYGFQRTTPPASDGTIEFFHPDFQRDQRDRMLRIRLPRQKRSREESEPDTSDLAQTLASLHSRMSRLEAIVSSQLSSLNAKLDPLVAAWTARPAAVRPLSAVISPNPCAACAVATATPLLAESPLAMPSSFGARRGLDGGLADALGSSGLVGGSDELVQLLDGDEHFRSGGPAGGVGTGACCCLAGVGAGSRTAAQMLTMPHALTPTYSHAGSALVAGQLWPPPATSAELAPLGLPMADSAMYRGGPGSEARPEMPGCTPPLAPEEKAIERPVCPCRRVG